jgi:glycerophosphoryl diester phosphodiesterase
MGRSSSSLPGATDDQGFARLLGRLVKKTGSAATKRPDVSRPLIFAHRGASRVAPENTLPAFEAAIRSGADGIELDVQYSSDGHLVVIHDLRLEALTNGTGRVTAQPLRALRALDAGSHFGPQFAGTRIPLLSEVLDLLRDKLLVNVELKVPDSANAGLGADVVAAVRAHGMVDQVVVSSFNPFALRRAKRAGPEIECALLVAHDLPGWMQWGLTRRYSRADGIHPEASMVDAAYIDWATKAHLPVRVWAVDNEAEIRRMIALGVDAVITDVPDLILAMTKTSPAGF